MGEEKEQLNYTLILHQIRKKLKLTLMEYCIADSIYHLSNNPKNKVQGWCYSSKEHIANFLGTTKTTVFDNINKLIKKGLVEKESETKYLRTTQKWYDNVVIIKIKADYQETLHTIKKLDSRLSRNLIPDYQETCHNNNNYNNINNNSIVGDTPNDTDKLKKPLLEEKPFNSESYIDNLSKDSQRHIQVIGLYWAFKHFKFENKKQAEKSLKRDMKAASNLAPYSDERITEVMDYLENYEDFKWTLETVFRYINDDLGELIAKKTYSKEQNYGNY